MNGCQCGKEGEKLVRETVKGQDEDCWDGGNYLDID